MPTAHRLAIVTGTSSGIGHAVALALLNDGWDVIGVARRDPLIPNAAYRHITLDLADLGALTATFEREIAALVSDDRRQRLGLVNNAARIGQLSTIDKTDPASMLAAYAVNVVAPSWLMGFMARHTPRESALRIVNLSSGAAQRPTPGLGIYVGTKAALRMASLNAAADFDSRALRAHMTHDVAVLSYSPGTVDTPMQVEARSQKPEEFPAVTMFKGFHEQGQLVPVERPAAEIVTFLESDKAAKAAERRLGDQ
ncbi:MAG: SDR family NAD(P)-dependent oxidoreductase [Gemmatimonadaceae bacterium]